VSGQPIEASGRPPSGRKYLASGRPCRKFENYFSDKENVGSLDGPGSCSDARASDSIFYSILGFQSL
jgi:hypothetical protein